MTAPIRVYVNEQPLDLPRGTTATEAVRQLDPALAERIADGTARMTDARGIALAPEAILPAGGIVRVIARAPRGPADEADADA